MTVAGFPDRAARLRNRLGTGVYRLASELAAKPVGQCPFCGVVNGQKTGCRFHARSYRVWCLSCGFDGDCFAVVEKVVGVGGVMAVDWLEKRISG